ncbi:hypothetical protein ANN_19810 [Periplaneta americana]|uniref:Uncharacterized protein n=1 Tax=Periplaneta americana TaxID=6978 RepID=A0ABQ8SBA4_PERAM|nr:hypothetical protein ANN_19810 [Periplaneta americana]
MGPESSTDSYPAFAHIELRKNPGKPQPGNLPQPGIGPRSPGFATRRANRYSTEVSRLGSKPAFDSRLQISVDPMIRQMSQFRFFDSRLDDKGFSSE